MENLISLDVLKPGQQARVRTLKTSGSIRRRLLDIGLVPETTVECIGKSPLGDPTAFLVRGGVIALRSEDCEKIYIDLSLRG